MNIVRVLGSGKATCKLCKKRIKKGILQITFYAYRDQGSIHGSITLCNKLAKEKD